MAENLTQQVVQGIILLSKNLRDERKKSLNEGSILQQNLIAQITALDRAKKNYEKAFREAEKSIEGYQRADADLNLSRAEVEKQRHNMTMKCGQSDDSKNEYANQLQKTNKLQTIHYESALPEVSRKKWENVCILYQYLGVYLIDCPSGFIGPQNFFFRIGKSSNHHFS